MAVDDTPTAAQDDAPYITGRSIMVGDAHRRGSPQSQEGLGDSLHSSERSGSTVGLDISDPSQQQSQIAAQRGRSRTNEEALAQSVADAGLDAFGCVFVEVWVMTDDGTKLTRPSGGHWMKPAFAQSLPNESLIEKAWELDRQANDCPPGAGLAGTLAEESGLGSGRVLWRQIKSLLNDPFVQRGSGKRMEKLFELGIGLVASVPFSFQDGKGIVLYFSRSTANAELLRAVHNERYLIGSTDLIGANYAIRKSRGHASELRKNMFRDAIKKVRKELLQEPMSFASIVMSTADMEQLRRERQAAQDAENNGDGLGMKVPRVNRFAVKLAKKTFEFGVKGLKRINNSRRKWRGAKLHGPPRQSFSDCLFCFTGVFLTMLTLLKVAKAARADSKWDFDAGWYSSTLCIVYALTPAPVGQPRQIFAAHLWNMLVGIACQQIPTGGFGDFMEWDGASSDVKSGMPLIWVQALAVALGVSGQAYIGIIHPPATGLSLTFASKPQWTWSTMASVMLADCIVVVISMIILNLSEKKQYPLYWLGFGWEGSGDTIGYVRNVRDSVRGRRKMKGEEAV